MFEKSLVDWSGGCETPAQSSETGETPQAQKCRGGSPPPRGK